MEESAIREGFENLRPGEEYDHLYEAALCRAKADWLVGINATRFFTILYQGKTLNVGRVMTPTLAILTKREQEIAEFKKEKFYIVVLNLGDFKVSGGRFKSRTEAEKVRKSCLGKPVFIQKVEREEKREKPPKLFDLTSLQREANRLYGYRAQQTLDYLQLLYEKKLVTYPRTDARYLTEDMVETVEHLCGELAEAFSFAESFSGKLNVSQVVDQTKVSDHHAILPTREVVGKDLSVLPTGEKNVLMLIIARLLCAVCSEDTISESTAVSLICNGTEFTAKGRRELLAGWKTMERAFVAMLKKKPDGEAEGEEAEEKEEGVLPEFTEGISFTAQEAFLQEGITSPPLRYTEGSLLTAMERAGNEDMGEETERKGLGTSATRAGIIEKLVKCGFVSRQKARGGGTDKLVPTKEGMNLSGILPEILKSPKLTAKWENALTLVAKGELAAKDFLAGIEKMVQELVNTDYEASGEQRKMFEKQRKVIGICPNCKGQVVSGKYGPYCQEKCGMNVNHLMGTVLSEAQVKEILAGKKILLKGLRSRAGKAYDAYVTPTGTEKYSYTKEGEKKGGVKFTFQVEFAKKDLSGGKKK